MRLAKIQAGFQAAVLAGEKRRQTGILDSIKNSARTDRETLFAVYVDAYRLRLAEFISNGFPMLRRRLGDDAFGDLVADYISSAPSHQRNARWYASRLPDFMCETAPWRENRGACDLARFEQALADAFDAADAPALAIDALREVGVDDWPRLVFALHPSVAVLDFAAGTAQLYESLNERGEAPIVRDGEETVVFWRSDGQSAYRRVEVDERLAMIETKKGKKFGEVCALLAFQRDDETATQRVAGFLSQWFADGFVTSLVAQQADA